MTPGRKSAFLTSLARDTGGNVLAMIAAAFIPLAALIGGSVDMARVYITKAKLQQACDAGALAGRKTMGSGAWSAGTATSPAGHADQLFAANFADGAFGTSELFHEYDEDEGTVSGEATVLVPMTLMRIFNQPTQEVAVTCTAEMEIPNTDVMFVLDLTASMNCVPGAATTCFDEDERANAKVAGLRSAVLCFYEALVKVNTTENCGANSPTATVYDGTAQIRLGFVPYDVNVNVGRLLDHDHVEDEPLLQTRRANFEPVYSWTVGALGTAGGWGSWSGVPSDIYNQSLYNTWLDRPATPATENGLNTRQSLNETSCLALNNQGPTNNRMRAYVDNGSPGSAGAAFENGTAAAPVHPSTDPQMQPMQRERTQPIYGYKYRFYSGSSGAERCRLQRGLRSYTQRQNGTAPRPVTWTEHQRFVNWTYSERRLDVSGLKGANDTWNATVTLADYGTRTGPSVKLSGSNNAGTFLIPADVTVGWGGCIMERKTFRNTDGNLADDWGTIPSDAWDMDINMIPTDDTDTQWKPMIEDVFWGRYTGTNRSSGKTQADVTTTTVLDRNLVEGSTDGTNCPVAARRLTSYNTSTNFEAYVTGLRANGFGTYHDIGMLWGARLLSPVGIFGEDNDLTENGGAIERHLIFMTDGNAQTFTNNLYAFGSPWWDRRQTNYVASATQLTGGVNGRLSALCTQIKNMNIKLWVIYYGSTASTADQTRLTNCASPNQFYPAADRAALISRFQQIASEIADLRLTQ